MSSDRDTPRQSVERTPVHRRARVRWVTMLPLRIATVCILDGRLAVMGDVTIQARTRLR